MEIIALLVIGFLCWAVVLPIWSIVSRSNWKRVAGESTAALEKQSLAVKTQLRGIATLEWASPLRGHVVAAAPLPIERVAKPRLWSAQPIEVPGVPAAEGAAMFAVDAQLALDLSGAAVAAAPQIALAPGAPQLSAIAAAPAPRSTVASLNASFAPIGRSSGHAAAFTAPVAEVVSMPPAGGAAAPARGTRAETKRAVETYSAWSAHVRPFLVENIGWFIGGFLIVAGSLYFLREAWGSFAQLGRHLLVVATALVYAAGFVGVALWLKTKHGLESASRAMAYVGLALVPVATLAASGTFAISGLAWGLLAPLAVAAAYPLLYLAAGLLDRPLAAPLARTLTGVLALVVATPAAAAVSAPLALVLPYAGWALVHRGATAPLRGTQAPSAEVLGFHLSALAYSFLFLLGLAHTQAGAALPFPAFYGPLAVLLSFTAIRIDIELRARWGAQPGIDVAVVAAFATTLAAVVLAKDDAALFSLSGALAAALFAAALAWYRRPLLLYFSLAAGTAAALSLALDLTRTAVDPNLAAALVLLGVAEAAAQLCRRFAARDEDRLEAAAGRASWILLALASIACFRAGLDAAPALGIAALQTATWHWRSPSKATAWASSVLAATFLSVLGLRFDLAPGLALGLAAAALVLLAAAALLREGERLGASALVQCSLICAGLALGADVLAGQADLIRSFAVVAAVWAFGAVVLGSALPGLVSALAAFVLLCVQLRGPQYASDFVQRASLAWIAPPAALLAVAVLARRLRAAAWKPLDAIVALPFPARGLEAIAAPLVIVACAGTAVFAIRGAVSIDAEGAAVLAGAALLSLVLAWATEAAAWTSVATACAALAAAWEAGAIIERRIAPIALGLAAGALVLLAVARLAHRFVEEHADAAFDVAAVALSCALPLAAVALAISLNGSGGDGDLWLTFATFATTSIGFALLIAPLHPGSGWLWVASLAGLATTLVPATGRPLSLIPSALAALALALVWTHRALVDRFAWLKGPTSIGAHAVALAALALNLATAGGFLDWNRSLCDALLLGYLASALAVFGGVVFLHLLLAVVALAVVRARTLLGIVPSGWGAPIAGAALLTAGILLRKRERYARVLFLWSGLALAYTAEWSVSGGTALFQIRYGRLALAALAAVPLAPWLWPVATSSAAVAALALSAMGAVPMDVWTGDQVALAPAALALVFALVQIPLSRLERAAWCAPKPLSRALEAFAFLLALLPAGLSAVNVFASALRLPGASLAGPGLAALPALLLAGAACVLVARKLSPAIPIVGAFFGAAAITAASLPPATVWAPQGGVLLLLAQAGLAAFVVSRLGDLPATARFIAPALCAAALVATHLAPAEGTTALAIAAAALFTREMKLPLSLFTWVLLAAAGFGLSWAGASVDFLGAAGVAAPLAVLAGLAMLFHDWRERGADSLALAVASVVLLAYAGGRPDPASCAAFLVAGGATLVWFAARRARVEAAFTYAAFAVAAALYAWLRVRVNLLGGFDNPDAAVALGTAFVLSLAQAVIKGDLATPLSRIAFALPAVLLFTTARADVPAPAFAAAGLYALLYWLRKSHVAAYAAVALVNVALFASLRAHGQSDAQLYGIPVGLSLLVAAQISRGDLARGQLSMLRGLGCLVLYAGTAVQMFQFDGPTYPLILAALAIATILAGVALQIRAFAFLGAATLVADVLANLIRASARSSQVLAVSATLTGFVILGTMIWFSVKRAESLALYRRLSRAMDDWE